MNNVSNGNAKVALVSIHLSPIVLPNSHLYP